MDGFSCFTSPGGVIAIQESLADATAYMHDGP